MKSITMTCRCLVEIADSLKRSSKSGVRLISVGIRPSVL